MPILSISASVALMRGRHRFVVLTVAVISAFVVATDWPLAFLNDFWRDHSLIGGVVSGLVLLAIGLVIVERWIDAQDSKRWRRVAETAFQDLADTQLETYRKLTLASDGRSHGYDVDSVGPTDVEVIVDSRFRTDWPGRCDRSVAVLSTDLSWCESAYRFLRTIEAEQRVAIGRWSPVMVQSDRLSNMLSQVSAANHCLRDLRDPLRHATRNSRPLGIEEAKEYGQQWLNCVILILQIRESLHNERRASQGKPPKTLGVALQALLRD
jgi:hypothetical protein